MDKISQIVNTFTYRSLESIVHNEAKEYAIYSAEERGIPQLVDGLKPVQRFVMECALQKSKGDRKKFRKMADIGSGVAELGYHHGETNAVEAGSLMANTWSNNTPLLDGQGNFGSRLVQKAGAARYIFARVHENFFKIYKDMNCAPKHEDLEHIPPAFYLPVVPMVLANGISGIATGYKTDILPHSLESLIECTELALAGKLDKEPSVQFPKFTGKVIPRDDRDGVILEGTYELNGKTKLTISEVPYKFDREEYVAVLDALEEKDLIVSYNDRCSKDGFRFEVTLKRDYFKSEDESARHEQIMKDFKLTQLVAQNIVVVNERGLVEVFEKASDLIRRFVEIRLGYVDKRIELMQAETLEAYNYAMAKAEFIDLVIKGEIELQGKKKAEVMQSINGHEKLRPYADKLVSMPLYSVTQEEYDRLVKDANKHHSEYEYWTKTTAMKEYKKDLKELKKG